MSGSGHPAQQTQRHYVPVTEALVDPVHREYVLNEAMGELKSWKRRYAGLKELSEVIAAAQRVEETLAA